MLHKSSSKKSLQQVLELSHLFMTLAILMRK